MRKIKKTYCPGYGDSDSWYIVARESEKPEVSLVSIGQTGSALACGLGNAAGSPLSQRWVWGALQGRAGAV